MFSVTNVKIANNFCQSTFDSLAHGLTLLSLIHGAPDNKVYISRSHLQFEVASNCEASMPVKTKQTVQSRRINIDCNNVLAGQGPSNDDY